MAKSANVRRAGKGREYALTMWRKIRARLAFPDTGQINGCGLAGSALCWLEAIGFDE
jgi:hypothetical protein